MHLNRTCNFRRHRLRLICRHETRTCYNGTLDVAFSEIKYQSKCEDLFSTGTTKCVVLMEVPAVSPFAFGLYASKIKEGMMMESPEEAIERLYREMQRKLGRELDE